ncbi:MAG: DUF2252 family protein [Polyangiaceae bacterium]
MNAKRSDARTLEALVSEQRLRDAALPPFLRTRKLERMRRSPHAFLRGTAWLFYALVRERGSLRRLDRRTGVLCGDLHVENFGAFRTNERIRGRSRIVFDVNDFDDATLGPQSLDVLRLTTSLLLATRNATPEAYHRLDLARRMLHAYDDARASEATIPPPPRFVLQLLARAKKRRGRQLVSERTERVGRDLRLVRGDRYAELSPTHRRAAIEAFARYAERTLHPSGATGEECSVIDVAYRVAGTGSLGAFRIAVLTRGRKTRTPWLFDMKEQMVTPNPSLLVPLPKTLEKVRPADRVFRAETALLESLPAAVGTTDFEGRSMLVRRLSPQEDKLNLEQVAPTDLGTLVPYLGAIVGRMHARACHSGRPTRGRQGGAPEALLEEAAVLAGMHETAHLLYATEAR